MHQCEYNVREPSSFWLFADLTLRRNSNFFPFKLLGVQFEEKSWSECTNLVPFRPESSKASETGSNMDRTLAGLTV